MARDVAGVIAGMELLEPGFSVDPVAPTTVGRLRPHDVDPAIDEAVDRALDEGERAVHVAIGRLAAVEVRDLDRSWFRNVNSPEQLGHT
jgi:hypothetical protein